MSRWYFESWCFMLFSTLQWNNIARTTGMSKQWNSVDMADYACLDCMDWNVVSITTKSDQVTGYDVLHQLLSVTTMTRLQSTVCCQTVVQKHHKQGFLDPNVCVWPTCHRGYVDNGSTLLAILFTHVFQCQVGPFNYRRLENRDKNDGQKRQMLHVHSKWKGKERICLSLCYNALSSLHSQQRKIRTQWCSPGGPQADNILRYRGFSSWKW